MVFPFALSMLLLARLSGYALPMLIPVAAFGALAIAVSPVQPVGVQRLEDPNAIPPAAVDDSLEVTGDSVKAR